MTDLHPEDRSDAPPAEPREPAGPPADKANRAPDAVRDPSEKTDGKPGVPSGGDEADPGGG